jgi:hypothetical protein
MNPFPYTKNPQTIKDAYSNLNHWWFEGMLCPDGYIESNWNTFIREMKRDANRDYKRLKCLS